MRVHPVDGFNKSELQKAIISELSLVKNANLLDLGSGDMRHNLEIYKKNKNHYYSIDVEKSGHPNKNKKPTRFYNGVKIPFKKNYFDYIILTEVLEHVEHYEKLKNDIYRVLKKNGKILITIPFILPEHEMPYDFRRFTLQGLINSFSKSHNYKILRTKKVLKGTLAVGRLISSEMTKTPKYNFLKFKLVDRFTRTIVKFVFFILENLYSFKNCYGGSLIVLVKKGN